MGMGGRGSQSPQARQRAQLIAQRALEWAKSKIGNKEYGRWAWNESLFVPGTAKCNLFVEHAFNRGNPQEKPFPFTPSKYLLTFYGRMRHYSAKEIYNGRLQNFKFVTNPKPGDIAADGDHVGIVSRKGATISASIITGKVVENDWGFLKNKKPASGMRFYRYTGDDK